MTAHKALAALGLAMRAGKLLSGDDMVLGAVQKRQVHLVLIAEDASAATAKKYRDKCSTYSISLVQAFSRVELSHAIGKLDRVVVGVNDQGFAQLIARHLGHNTEVDHIEQQPTGQQKQ